MRNQAIYLRTISKDRATEGILFMDGQVSLLISSLKSIDYVFLFNKNKTFMTYLYFC